MFGGPWYSNGAARVINGVTYHYKRVSFAHWAQYYGARSHWKVTKDRRTLALCESEQDLNALFDRIAAGEVVQPVSERKRLARLQERSERAAARAAKLDARRPLGEQLEISLGVSAT